MKTKFIIFLIFIIVSIKTTSQNIVPSEIFQSVFLLKHGGNLGTCFLVSINSNDYLITAKHLFLSTAISKTSVDIELFRNDGWIKFNPVLLLHDNPNIDIAVLDLKTNVQKENLFDVESKGVYISQDCFFLGFPFGLKMDDKEGKLHNGFPIPFVKKGIISSITSDTTNMVQFFLDGHNNPGFSGGPVVVTNYGSGNKHKMKVFGVVSAYFNEEKIIKTPIGDFKNNENSGIVICYGIDPIFEIVGQK